MLERRRKNVEAILSIVVILLMLLSFFEPFYDSIFLLITIIVGCISLIVMDLTKDEPSGHYITWTFNAAIWIVILLIESNVF